MALVNHTWTNVGLALLPVARWPAEVDRTSRLLRRITGHPARCLRPPYGRGGRAVDARLRARGLAGLGWDVDPSDYLRPAAAMIARAGARGAAPRRRRDHARRRRQPLATVAALPAIIRGTRAAGYQIVLVCGG